MRTARPGRVAARLVALAFAGATVGCGSSDPPAHHRLDIQGLAYRPAELTVAVGDTVSWHNADIVPHTVTASGAGPDSGELAADAVFTTVVTSADTLRYACRYHPGMTGIVIAR